MSQIEYRKVQSHPCPDCGATVLREVMVSAAGDEDGSESTLGYVCAARCGWQIQGQSLPVR